MRSVADLLKTKDRQAVLALSVDERIELALRLGDEDLALFCAAQGLTPEEGRRELQRRRQAGRRPCGCIEELLR